MILQEQIRNDDYKQIFKFAPSAIIEIDDSGCILNYNLSAESLLSQITEEIPNTNLIDIASSESREKISGIISHLLKSKLEEFTGLEAEFESHDLSILTLLLRFSVIESAPEDEKRIFVTLEDISKYKEDQQYYRRYFEEIQITRDDLEVRTSELAMLNEKLRQSEIELEKMNKNKDRFFSIISHDLRSPFNSLLGLTRWMMEDFDSFSKEEIKESVTNLYQVSEGLFHLLEDLLDWSRIQFNRIDFQPEVFNLHNVITRVLTSLKPVAIEKNINVVNLVSKNCTINADQHMIQAIIRNLVNNSIKFTPHFGLIKITAGFDLEDLIILVEDTGVGMTSRTLQNLFKLESKTTTKGTEGESGTGLGLLICREFVEKHNGKIWATSELEKGSKFFIRIPLEPKISTN